jgi:alanine-glyoxylate transaminase/serine-glyoxylate transaminase/serine-pyruvate transaminase
MKRNNRGRQFFVNPGPTNIPDSVLKAVQQASVEYNDSEFLAVYDIAYAGLKRVLGTTQELFMYNASGHGAWEAALQNLFSPGDTILVIESGMFSDSWAEMAGKLGLTVRNLPADWRSGAAIADLAAALRADDGRQIRAVCAVHNETSTGVVLPLTELRAALDAAGHPALLLVDTISSLGCMPFEMDKWGVDVTVGGSQKGLMLPTGMSFTGVSAKAMAAHATARMPRAYFDWTPMTARRQRSFIGTVPIAMFYGLRESIRLIEEEGLAEVQARHHRLAEAVRRAVRVWAGNGSGPQIYCTDPTRMSDSVTAILMPEGHNAEKVRSIAVERFNTMTGGGLARLSGKAFRIGHMGDLNEPMIIGALGAVEMSLKLAGVPHQAGGVAAAMAWLAESAQQDLARAA